MKSIAFFIIFKGLLVKHTTQFSLEGEGPTLPDKIRNEVAEGNFVDFSKSYLIIYN